MGHNGAERPTRDYSGEPNTTMHIGTRGNIAAKARTLGRKQSKLELSVGRGGTQEIHKRERHLSTKEDRELKKKC